MINMEIKSKASIGGKLRVYVLDASKVPDEKTALELLKKGELWKYVLQESEANINQ